MRILIFLVVVFLPIFAIIKLFLSGAKARANKQKQSTWKGKLVDKERLEYEDDDSPYKKDLYTLHFETTDNSKVKMNVSKTVFDQWTIGDTADKKLGSLLPDKTS
jgi:hypothetical protein